MLDKLTGTLDFQSRALALRAERQQLLAGNIANADTPGYAARDFDFAAALQSATTEQGGALRGGGGSFAQGRSDARHIALASGSGGLREDGFALQTQPALDANSVDLDRERAAFADNAVRFEASLRFINAHGKTLLSAIQGQ